MNASSTKCRGAIADPATPPSSNTLVAADPRVSHSVTLEVDSFGDVVKSVEIAYGRRFDDNDPVLTVEDKREQKRAFLIYTENNYINSVMWDDAHRTRLSSETAAYELIQTQVTNLFRFNELRREIAAAGDGNHDLPYEDVVVLGTKTKDPYRALSNEHVPVSLFSAVLHIATYMRRP